MRRRKARGRTLSATELVEAVRESGLTVQDGDALRAFLDQLGGYTSPGLAQRQAGRATGEALHGWGDVVRRRTGQGRTLTARELVEAVRESGLTVADGDALHEYLDELGGYDVIHWLRARCVVKAADHGHAPRTGHIWDDGRPGGNQV